MDAVEILDAEGIQAGVVAGGTDLVVANRMGKRRLPSALVAIHRITEMRGIVVERKGACGWEHSSRTRILKHRRC